MAITKSEFSSYIKEFRFKELFNYFGWDNDKTVIPVEVDGYIYNLVSVAQKSGFKIFTCSGDLNGRIPLYAVRRKIDNKLTAYSHDHIVIYSNGDKTKQLWQFIYKSSGQPQRVAEICYNVNQDVERLYQRTSGLVFELDEEDKITIVDVTNRVRSNFGTNSEKVTKKFYDSFKKHHKAFLGLIKGIDDQLNKEWYASLMLNRLMFCYFIQKRGFLNGNKNYLRDKLNECKSKNGDGKFYSFYRAFLLKLFHRGLGSHNHTAELYAEIGNIPYLNGGLFDDHEIEQQYEGIDIEDYAFEKVFDFFDEYEWHLDTRRKATGNEINPDVIGYIFEKYINDRAQMGAYYTQEDITEYISKNCILPFLMEETKKKYPKAFERNEFIWSMLKESGDKYIYSATKYGIEKSLPEEIEVGIDTSRTGLIDRRSEWNKAASTEFALPTETWREVVNRRNIYFSTKSKIENGDITNINDFITNNLNIRQFVQDIIETVNDPDFIRIFYGILKEMTILDPTCGSGAFLFAALNILEPIYEACIMRMRQYISESDKPRKYKAFEIIIDEIDEGNHPSQEYYIYKSIILKNLYGVDIMKEAVETAKLRLFLKLISTVEPNYTQKNMGLEPLPDIDFNIKFGNTLVGYASELALDDALNLRLDGMLMKGEIKQKCLMVERANNRYKAGQLEYGFEFSDFKEAKKDLDMRQKELNNLLNKLYAGFGAKDFDKWLAIYRPFHWFAEFYDIVAINGGFDVVIGNPPYVNFKKVEYKFPDNSYNCLSCKDLFALTVERAYQLTRTSGFVGVIIPLSATSTNSMKPLGNEIYYNSKSIWTSYYSASDQPSSLFCGVRHRLLSVP